MDKGDERRKQLLQVALDIFIEKGYYGTSTREIARRAGVSSGLLFHYFSNKESICLELVKIGVEEMKIDTQTAMEAPYEYLFQTMKNVFEQLEGNPFFGKMFVFMDNVQHTAVNDQDIELLLESTDICKQWIPIILEGQRRGEFREGNPHALCVAVFGAIQGIAQEKVRIPDTPLPKMDWLMDMIANRTKQHNAFILQGRKNIENIT